MGNASSKSGNGPRPLDSTFVKLDNDKLSYHPGDMVSGTIFIQLDQLDAFLLRGVELIVRGTEEVGWTERHTHTTSDGKGGTAKYTTYKYPKSAHHFFDQSFLLADKSTLRKYAHDAHNALQKRFCVPFRFQIPHRVPGTAHVSGLRGGRPELARAVHGESFDGESFDGYARCSYSVASAVRVDLSDAQMQTEAQRSWRSKAFGKDQCNDLCAQQVFNVLELPTGPVRAAETRAGKKIKTCCCFSRGEAFTELSVAKNAYQCGDVITATARIDNTACRKGVKTVSAILRRIVVLKTHVDEEDNNKGPFFRRRARHFASDESVINEQNGRLLALPGAPTAAPGNTFPPHTHEQAALLQEALAKGLACAPGGRCQRQFDLALARELEGHFPPSCHGNLVQISYEVEVQSTFGSCRSSLECRAPVTLHSAALPAALVNEAVPLAQQQAFMAANPTAIANTQVFYVSPDFGDKQLPPSFNPFARQLECPICLDAVHVGSGAPEWKCRMCHRDGRNPIHPQCALAWVRGCVQEGNRAECPLCREALDHELDVRPLEQLCGGHAAPGKEGGRV